MMRSIYPHLDPIPKKWLEGLSSKAKQALENFFSTIPFQQFREEAFSPDREESFKEFVEDLVLIEEFYASIGGIVGYYKKFIAYARGEKVVPTGTLFPPTGWNLYEENDLLSLIGLMGMVLMGEIYPVGGAGDRLNLASPQGDPLPVACLPFLGRSSLEGLIRDLQAREFLFFKLFSVQVITPVALMTSEEKHNHEQIHQLLEDSGWYGRSPNYFFLFKQPLAPLLTLDGHWVLNSDWKLTKKPGGHGVIWKLAEEKGVFDWFEKHGRSKGLIRQINNPLAGLDNTLTSFIGVGIHNEKAFGFLSCQRRVGAPEGVDVIVAEEQDGGTCFRLSCIEYTDFKIWGIEDIPAAKDAAYSQYPSNTNILFVDFRTIRKLSLEEPLPALLLNPKTKVLHVSPEAPSGEEVMGGRLESLMQGLADRLTSFIPNGKTRSDKNLRSFIAFNERKKTISVTKRSFEAGKGLEDTPEGAYQDVQLVMKELLEKRCQVECPEGEIHFLYHPGMGPLFSLISQKIRGGKFHKGAELELELAELSFENVELSGSLLIKALAPLGHFSETGELTYSHACGKCILENVKIDNQGIEFQSDNKFWKREIERKERLEIVLEGDCLFEAKGVCLTGNQKITVPDGWIYSLSRDGLTKVPINRNSPIWEYGLDQEEKIVLTPSLLAFKKRSIDR